jgi:hypothetical protein
MMNNRISDSLSVTARFRLVTPNSRLVTFITLIEARRFHNGVAYVT